MRTLCAPGDHVVVPGDAYGGTFRLFAKVLERWGLTYTAVDQRDPAAVRDALGEHTKLIWCETPTNPLLAVVDIASLAAVAHEAGAVLAVDNTFASPYLQRPLTLGADVVMHSTTKYLGGHSDVIGGALVVADDTLPTRSRSIRTRWEVWPAHSTPGWYCAASRRSGSAWTVTVTTPNASSRCCASTRPSATCTTPTSMRSLRSRCRGSAGWCHSRSRAVSRRPWRCAAGHRCSPSPSHWAAWSRSSSTPLG